MSKLHFEILTEEQKKTFKSLKAFSGHGVLAGGTALALQFFHRKSYDFDIFYKSPISKSFLLKVKNHFNKLQILIDTADELSIVSPLGVKVSFIHYPFHPLYRIIPTQSLGLQSWKDIALDKAYAIGRRGEWRDYIDLYFCLKAGRSFKGIMNGCKKKFGVLFSEKLFLSQLCYFGDIRDFSIDFVNREVTSSELQNFFKREVKSLGLNPLIS